MVPVISRSRATISAKCLNRVPFSTLTRSGSSSESVAGYFICHVNVFASAKDLVAVTVYLQAACLHHESSIIRTNPHFMRKSICINSMQCRGGHHMHIQL